MFILQNHSRMTLNPNATRHPKFWFSDGSVVLGAQGTIFRVHRSILCNHSDAFKGMFDIPPPDMIEQLEGCPYVQLQDEVQDIEAFINVLYNPLWWDENNTTTKDMVSLAISILKISNKYGCDILRKKSISILKDYIPTDMACYNKLKCKKLPVSVVVRLLSVAREAKLRIFLPCAYLAWATRNPEQIIEHTQTIEHENLPWEDAAICLAGRAILLPIQLNDVFKFAVHFENSSSCSGSSCAPFKMDGIHQSFDKLAGYIKWNDESITEGICKSCRAHAKERFEEGQKYFWNMLPKAFRLGSWEALKQEAQDFE
ncbi:hypothetical protein BDQ17DRAFT_1547388 [Cyathus striatus]|nr:hypothetical protein BDQ17DRAFT_1547388 [Cyathus striatus]